MPVGDFIAYDDNDLFPQINRRFGPYVLAMVLAHEFGHSIQLRAGVDQNLPTILLEQQADCFAGAWMARVAHGDAPGLQLDDKELTTSLAGMVRFSDSPGTSADDQEAHGSAFDRIGAFQDGYARAPTSASPTPTTRRRCSSCPSPPRPTWPTTATWRSTTIVPDHPRRPRPLLGGGLRRPFGHLRQARRRLQAYPDAGPFPTCLGVSRSADFFRNRVFYCASGDYIGYDEDTLAGPVYDIGDFAVSVLLANAWSDAMQSRLGVTATGKDVRCRPTASPAAGRPARSRPPPTRTASSCRPATSTRA